MLTLPPTWIHLLNQRKPCRLCHPRGLLLVSLLGSQVEFATYLVFYNLIEGSHGNFAFHVASLSLIKGSHVKFASHIALFTLTEGSHVDFASHVASYALGPDWMDLFDIVIFFARKPSFFIDR